MRIEAFSEGKYLDDPDANEDQFLILPGRGYAVIDGVTDISGRVVRGHAHGPDREPRRAAGGRRFPRGSAQEAKRPRKR